jgi:hypothetical protein
MKNRLPLRYALLALALLPATVLSADQPNEIRLWPNGAPGSEGKAGPESVRVTENGERVVSNVHQPSLTRRAVGIASCGPTTKVTTSPAT